MSKAAMVYVVDDDDAARESLRFLLETAHLAVRAYQSARSFLDVLAAADVGCVITGHADVPLAVDAMKAGAVDFIEKPYDGEALLGSVRSALSVRGSKPPRDGERAEIETRLAVLTQRERQVLDGLIAGRSNKVIAHDLGISARTAEIYRANVMAKMQATSLSQLVRMALIAAA